MMWEKGFEQATQGVIIVAKDPVCGMDVEEGTAAGKSVYKGQTYYFCSTGCKAAFDKDPEKYLGGKGKGS